jgi:hypothetical protein
MDVTTDGCQAPPGAAFYDSRSGAVLGGEPQDVAEHTWPQRLSDRLPSSTLSRRLWRHDVVEYGKGQGSTTGRSQVPLDSLQRRRSVVKHGVGGVCRPVSMRSLVNALLVIAPLPSRILAAFWHGPCHALGVVCGQTPTAGLVSQSQRGPAAVEGTGVGRDSGRRGKNVWCFSYPLKLLSGI